MSRLGVVGETREARASEHELVELRAAFDGARDALLMADLELRCVRANDAASRLLGRPRAALIGVTAAEVVAPESLRDLDAGWAAALRNGGGTGLITILRPDGVRRTAEYSATAEVVPGLHLISLRDVTERVEMEETLRRTMAEVTAVERRYADLIETLPDGIVAVDTDGAIALVNARTEQMFGYVRGELIGRRVEMLLPERMRAAHGTHRARFGHASRSRAMGLGLDLWGHRKDGSDFPVEVSLSAVTTDQGKLVTSVVTDITERMQLEQQLQQSQKLEAIGRLAGGVAHDFNNVLQVISGYATSLQERASGELDLDELGEIAAAADRAAALTQQLLAFSRRQVLQPVPLDLNAIVGETERMLARMIGEDVELSVDLDPDLAHVLVDRARMEQVLANLAVNARDAMPRGGRVLISTRNVELNGDAGALGLEPGEYVCLCVTDTGFGMDEQTAARAFDPFFTTKADGQGTGLGLATVHGIVAQSGGHVRMHSVPDQGTTVSIHLPAVEAESPRAESAAEPEDPLCLDGKHVLLVEDEPVVRRLLEFFLAKLGCVVTPTADGRAALEAGATAETPFDLVVTDLVLPGMSGCELVERLAESGGAPPTLYLSGYSRDADLREATSGGRGGFLQKPFTGDELGVAMRSLLRAGGGA